MSEGTAPAVRNVATCAPHVEEGDVASKAQMLAGGAPLALLGGGDILLAIAPGRCYPKLVCTFKENDPVDGYLQYTTIGGVN